MEKIFAQKSLPCRQIESFSILHIGEQKVFLNQSGTEIWNLIDGKRTADQIAAAVAQGMLTPEAREEVGGKVRLYLDKLYSRGLLWQVEGGRLKGLASAPEPGAAKADLKVPETTSVSAPLASAARAVQEVCMTPRVLKEEADSVESQVERLYWEKNYIQKMHLELTYRCNFRCVHCYNTTHSGSATELTTDEWCNALDQLAEMGCWLLTFTGGELFVRKDAADVLEHACKRGFSFRLNTNGSLIDERMLKRLEPMRPFLQSVDISFYGASPDVHDTLSRKPGGYYNTLRALTLLHEAKMGVVSKFITMRDNFDGIETFESDMQKLGVRYVVSTGALIPQTNRDTKPLVQILTDAQYKKLLVTRPLKGASDPGNCKPGHVRGAITPEGYVSPCEWLTDLKYGNLRERPLKEIWYSAGFLGFRNVFEEESECPTCSLRSGCGRCPAHSYLETGHLLHCAPIQRHNAELYEQHELERA